VLPEREYVHVLHLEYTVVQICPLLFVQSFDIADEINCTEPYWQ